MITTIRDRLVEHSGRLLVGAGALFLGFALLVLATSVTGQDQEEVDAEAETVIAGLEEDRDTARADLRSEHESLLDELPGVDHERVERDEGRARSLVLSLTRTSASTGSTSDIAAELATRHEILDADSQVLTTFLPEWLSTTRDDSGDGRTYRLSEIDTQVTGRSNLTYSYVTLARLDPVALSEQPADKGHSELILLTFSTSENGDVTRVQANRISSESRNDLLEQRRQARSADQSEPNDADETGETD